MFYNVALKIPAATTRETPIREIARLTSGEIDQVSISFPAGCHGLVGVRVLHREFQLWPLTPGAWFITDDFTIRFPGRFELDDEPFELNVEGYNDDTKHPHTIAFRFSLVSGAILPEAIAWRRIMANTRLTNVILSQDFARNHQDLQRIHDLLFAIHAQDFPMLFAYLNQLKES